MPARRYLLLPCVLVGIVAFTGRPHAEDPPAAAFHAVGDLDGAGDDRFSSVIRDATRVVEGGTNVIYAVGGSVARPCDGSPTLPCFETDTAVLWRFDGTNPATLQALPALPSGVANTTATSNLTAYAITPDAVFIASQARSGTALFARRAVRVTTSPLANLNLNTVLPPALAGNTAAVATSNDGTILYGFNLPGLRGARFDAGALTSTLIPFVCAVISLEDGCPAVDTQNPVAERGTSADGSVAVGSSYSTAANHKAYRYVHASGVTAIPLLDGGTFNDALAVSPDGNRVLVTGDSATNSNGEAYLYCPGFSAVVVGTLALGIGGTTAVFSVVQAVLLAPLPYEEPGELVRFYQQDPQEPESPAAGY